MVWTSYSHCIHEDRLLLISGEFHSLQQFLTARGAPQLSCTISNAGFCSTLIASFMRTLMRPVGRNLWSSSPVVLRVLMTMSLFASSSSPIVLDILFFCHQLNIFSDSPRFVSHPVICSQTFLAAGQWKGQEHGKERLWCREVEEMCSSSLHIFPSSRWQYQEQSIMWVGLALVTKATAVVETGPSWCPLAVLYPLSSAASFAED